MGYVELPPVALPAAPRGSAASVQKLRDAIELLYRVRRVTDAADEAAPLARAFLADWAAIPPRTAETAKGKLIAAGVIVKDGETVGRSGRRTSLWAPRTARTRA